MTVPLRHFVISLGFLLLGSLVGIGLATGLLSTQAALVHVHLLLAGWVCITIMGAMTQFVPVWSGAQLHSRRLAAVQLWLVVVGLVGFAGGLLSGQLVVVPVFGTAMVLGFWIFAYNIARTLWSLDSYDVTERHFALALGFFLLLTSLGYLLAVDFVRPVFTHLPVDRTSVVRAHATLAVFGAILTTVLGALYQLGTMFTQTELHGIDIPLRRIEEIGYPVGVVALATGRLFDVIAFGIVGGGLVLVGLLGFSAILARRLYETQVDWTPMLSRYAVLAPALALWVLLTTPVWLRNPLPMTVLFGAPGTVHLLTVGVIGFVVLGTLYHIVPFIIWVHRYSDLLGYEDVPMIDDLYDDRIATVDLVCFITGGALITVAEWFSLRVPTTAIGGAFVICGSLLFLWNMLTVIQRHSPHSILGLLFPPLTGDQAASETPPEAGSEQD